MKDFEGGFTRPVMTSDELRAHKVNAYGRHSGGDGYDDMETNAVEGWRAIASWGRDGWDLGDWPYQVYSVRVNAAKGSHELLEVCEGDHTVYRFDSLSDLHAALDLTLWTFNETVRETVLGEGNAYNAEWGAAPVPSDLDTRFRGPFSWERLNAFTANYGAVMVDDVMVAMSRKVEL